MSRMYQVFCAPGPEEEALPTPDSPWTVGRCSRAPLEHWERLEELLAGRLPQYLDLWDRGCWVDHQEFLDRDETEELRAALVQLRDLVSQVEPLTPEVTEEIPENYTPEEHQRMLSATIAVLEEALRLEEPFDSWID